MLWLVTASRSIKPVSRAPWAYRYPTLPSGSTKESRSNDNKDTVVMVMSDHGFNPFHREFNLNTWLKENGYHRHLKDWRGGEETLFENTDWSRTRAHGPGENGRYPNP